MALEDLTGAKYLDSLVATNPAVGDDRVDPADHLRGIKNVTKNSFSALDGAVNCTPAELNLLVGETVLGENWPTGIGAFFYQSAAPTGWTQDTTTSNLDGSGLRIETGTGGGAVAGTHDVSTPPSADHDHAHTFALDSHVLTEAEIPSHYHQGWLNADGNDSTPGISASYGVCYHNSGGTTNYKYLLNGSTGITPNVAPSGFTGSGSGHVHTVTGSIASASLTEFAPKYINVILCTKDA